MIWPLLFTFVMQVDPTVPLTPIEVGRDSTKSFAFDWSGTHSDGSAGAEVTEAEFQYTPPPGAGQQRWVRLPHTGVAGENRIAVKDALVAIPAGIYDLQLRLLDPGGQPSTYSPVLSIRVRVKNPSAPQNVRVVGG